jgi:hypothetical protein
MNVLILTPDRVGSTLLQRVLTVYMLRKNFGKPVINLHELTNGLEKYYNETLCQEVLGKPKGTEWGYYQTLTEIQSLLESVDHYKTSRLAHYHLLARQDTIADQLKFYNYLNENFYIISCRRENLFEYALSWGIQGHSKKLNTYSAEEKINTFYDIYKNKITISKETLVKYMSRYKEYIAWSDTHFNIQSTWNYDTDVQDIETYILNLDFMKNSTNNTWKDMFGQEYNAWNTCHRMLPNLQLLDRPEAATKKINLLTKPVTEAIWDQIKGPDWPQTAAEFLTQSPNMLAPIEEEIKTFLNETTLSVTDKELLFLEKNVNLYTNTNSQLLKLVNDGFLVTSIPLKLQSLKEKQLIVSNFDQCVDWYNEWVKENNFGKIYNKDELTGIMTVEDQNLDLLLDQQNLLQ